MTSYIERRSEAYLSGDERTIRAFFVREGVRHLPPQGEFWRCIYVAVSRIASFLPEDALFLEDTLEETDSSESCVSNPLGSYTWEELSRRAVVCMHGQGATALPREASYKTAVGQTVKIPYYFYGKTPHVAPPRAK